MSVPISCPNCKTQCFFGEEFLGRVVQCLYCGKQMRLPAQPPAAAPAPRPAPRRAPQGRPAAVQPQVGRPARPAAAPRAAPAPVPSQGPARLPTVPPPKSPVPPPGQPPGGGGAGKHFRSAAAGLFRGGRWLVKQLFALLGLLTVGLFRGGRWLVRRPRVLLPTLGVTALLVGGWFAYRAIWGPSDGSSATGSPAGGPQGGKDGKKGETPVPADELITLADDEGRLTCAVFSRDGTAVITGCEKQESAEHLIGLVKSWPLDTRKPKQILKLPRPIKAVAASPRDKAMAAATAGGSGWESVHFWIPNKTEAEEPLPLPWPNFGDGEEPQGLLAFSADGGRLLAVGRDRLVGWEPSADKAVAAARWPFAVAAALAPDGKEVAVATYPGITVYQLPGAPYALGGPIPMLNQPRRIGLKEGTNHDVFALTFGPEGKVAARARRLLKPTDDPRTAGDVLILADVNGKWQAADEAFRAHDEGRLWVRTETVQFSPDGKTVASGGSGWLALWDANTGKVLAKLREPALPQAPPDAASGWGEPLMVSFSPNGRTIASVWMDGKVRLWTPRPVGGPGQ